ncbi:hypothetical protein [Nocardioides sp.]|uniref:hypothetical protein n=1 Tax=Nocardioides sp. TaxID=35761 RepID=UPI002638D0CB|nr:hypothetical protein [Nocardioides sp.]
MHALPHRTPRSRRTTLAATGALLLLLGTAACGADDVADQAAESAVERAIEDAASSEGVDVDIDSGDGSVSIESSDGTFTSGMGALPQGFPEDIPVLEGEILQGASSDGNGTTGWFVSVAVDQSADEALADAAAALEGAGYSEGDNSMAMEGLSYVQYVGSEWEIILGATDDGQGGTLLSYTVTPPTS